MDAAPIAGQDGRQGFDRLSYWEALAAQPRPGVETVFQFPCALCLAMSQADRDAIDTLVFDIVLRSWRGREAHDPTTPEGRQAILGLLETTTRFSIDTDGNIDRLVALEARVLETFGRLGLTSGIVGWQFPLDIRVVHPRPPEGYLNRPDATDYLHCDPWRGEPDDIVNVVIYCAAGDRASQLELYAIDPADLAPFESYQGAERDAHALLDGRAPVAFDHRPGQVILFDAYMPHRTRRIGEQIRVSLNFSMRRRDPYAAIDERWDRPRQAWHKFWLTNERMDTTFTARCAHELGRLAGRPTDRALAARHLALLRHFPAYAEA